MRYPPSGGGRRERLLRRAPAERRRARGERGPTRVRSLVLGVGLLLVLLLLVVVVVVVLLCLLSWSSWSVRRVQVIVVRVPLRLSGRWSNLCCCNYT